MGFEPTRRLNTAYAISNRAPSANSDTSPYVRSLPNDGGRIVPVRVPGAIEHRCLCLISLEIYRGGELIGACDDRLPERLRSFRKTKKAPKRPTPITAQPPKSTLGSMYSSS